jgi:integrase
MAKRLPEGISLRHARSCPSRSGGRCRCAPTYQAQAWSPRDRKRLTRTFPTLAAARGWPYDALVGLRHGTLRAAGGVTLRHAADEWLAAGEAGIVRNRSGDVYKPSVLRGYEQSLRTRLLPALGGAKLSDIRRSDVQRLVNRMMADGVGASTVRNSLLPLRAIYRQALALDEVAVNPTTGVQLPAVRGKRERIATPTEAAQLLAALPQRDRAVWATALYAGLRSGELQALTDELVDLDSDVIRVQWSWDPVTGPVAPKSRSGRRTVPVPTGAPEAPARAPPRPRPPRWPLLRPTERSPVLESVAQSARREDLASRRPRADRPARVPAHLRLAHDRRRRQREGPFDLPRPRLGDHHVRPLRPPLSGLREGGRGAPRQLPRMLPRRGFRVRVRCTCAALRCTNRPFSGVERGRLGSTNNAKSTQKRPAHQRLQRRGRDSNPRWTVRPTTVFETAPFNRSGTPPGV